jgi:hypothetical protein
MPGTQYLHQPIPALSAAKPDGIVTYVKVGTRQGYANKVYGSPDAPCSWAKFQPGDHEIWHLGQMYSDLWDTFETSIVDMEISPNDIATLCAEFPIVISSIPRTRICENPFHKFRNQTIWISQEPNIGPILTEGKNVIIYDGTRDVHWYRASQIFGKYATETTKVMSDSGWQYGHKPISTDCDCHARFGNFFNVGRFGLWKKGVLSHNAFWDTVTILEKNLGKKEDALLQL